MKKKSGRTLTVFVGLMAAAGIMKPTQSFSDSLDDISITKTEELCEDTGGKVVGSSKFLGEIELDSDEDGFGKIKYKCFNPVKGMACREIYGENYFYDHNKLQCAEDECFMTSACADIIGLEDDCFELRTLRAFRDNYLLKAEGGQQDVDKYYVSAPNILDELAARGNADLELSRVYALYILPSAITAKLGLNRLTRIIYTRMMMDLSNRIA